MAQIVYGAPKSKEKYRHTLGKQGATRRICTEHTHAHQCLSTADKAKQVITQSLLYS